MKIGIFMLARIQTFHPLYIARIVNKLLGNLLSNAQEPTQKDKVL